MNMSGGSRGAMTETGGVTGVMAGDGPSERSTSRSGLSNDTSSVASERKERFNRTEHTLNKNRHV